jgi:hypothetical protein
VGLEDLLAAIRGLIGYPQVALARTRDLLQKLEAFFRLTVHTNSSLLSPLPCNVQQYNKICPAVRLMLLGFSAPIS